MQAQKAGLLERDRTVIGRHIFIVFNKDELDKNVVYANFAHTFQNGELKRNLF